MHAEVCPTKGPQRPYSGFGSSDSNVALCMTSEMWRPLQQEHALDFTQEEARRCKSIIES